MDRIGDRIGQQALKHWTWRCGLVVGSAGFLVPLVCAGQGTGVIAVMASNEVAARQHVGHFAYTSEEKSDRTGMHLWREMDVEVGDGIVRRLIAIDGRPLSPDETAAETRRLDALAKDPDEYRRLNAGRKDDEVRATALLQLMSRAFVLTPDGTEDGCVRFRFVPNPSFSPSTYEERVGAAMAGTVSLREPENRLCKLQGTLQHPVTFGFGLLGKVESGGNFLLERGPVAGSEWKSKRINVHMEGKILLMKSLSKQQETVRTDVRRVADSLTVEQAVQMMPAPQP